MLTIERDCGLMRSVARIAQSVEQGIENPRVGGSIPPPGTTIRSTLVRGEKTDGRLTGVVLVDVNPHISIHQEVTLSIREPADTGSLFSITVNNYNDVTECQPL